MQLIEMCVISALESRKIRVDLSQKGGVCGGSMELGRRCAVWGAYQGQKHDKTLQLLAEYVESTSAFVLLSLLKIGGLT